jgi:hypothetical protein
MKKTFRVQAETITYCYVDIEAKSIEDANEKAEQMDGGDFITTDEGDFNVLDSLTKEICPNCDDMELELDEECPDCGRKA